MPKPLEPEEPFDQFCANVRKYSKHVYFCESCGSHYIARTQLGVCPGCWEPAKGVEAEMLDPKDA